MNIPEFTPTEWSTSEDKKKFARQFLKLINNGFQKNDFPNWFYKRLSMCFGHIAHYNQDGFYQTWFSTKQSQIDFLRNAMTMGGYGSPAFTFSDVEQWLKQHPDLNRVKLMLEAEFHAEGEAREKALYEHLKSKYG